MTRDDIVAALERELDAAKAENATLRAALSQPQAGEDDHIAFEAWWDSNPAYEKALADCKGTARSAFLAARLLRATQSTNMTPAVAGSPSALSERPASSDA